MRAAILRALIGATLLANGACGDKNDKDSGGGGASLPVRGCVQGVLMNGLSGDRVPLKAGPNNGVFVLVQGSLIPASFIVPDPEAASANPNLVGEFSLCEVPLDETFPIFAWADGFQPFEGEVEIASTRPARSPQAKVDVLRPLPSDLANIRLYPKAQDVKDLEVVVLHNAAPLAGAQIVLRAVGTNFLDDSGFAFIPPANVRSPTLRGTTDAAGRAVFAAADLVLGGHYTYTVIPPAGGTGQTAVAADNFVLGLRGVADTTEPYKLFVDLDHAVGPLLELSRSTDNQDPDSTGKLVVYFNRELEVVPGSADLLVATLSGNTSAALVPNVTGNDSSEQVKLTIEANRLTLEPVMASAPNPDTTKELDLAITYSGLSVRPKGSPRTLGSVNVTGTVRYYK